jgi:hypothetical protein
MILPDRELPALPVVLCGNGPLSLALGPREVVMSEWSPQSGSVRLTPEGGPVDAGAPAAAPGAGQVQATPEAAPLADDQLLTPPTLREHMRGPIPGLDDAPPAEQGRPSAPPAAAAMDLGGSPSPDHEVSEELRKWPPHTGKPVSETDWRSIGRYAAPIAAQAEQLAIKGIDLSARGLSRLARYLESRREQRNEGEPQ